jgi:hydrogenase maturation protease
VAVGIDYLAVQGGEAAAQRAAVCPTLVLGLGNILLQDEGVGVRVVEALQGLPLPPGVEVVDGATAGMALLDILADRRRVIVIDAVDGDWEPGTVVRLGPDDLLPQQSQAVSLHELGLLEALIAARRLGVAPQEMVILGVRPYEVACGLSLSREMAALLPRVVKLVLAELGADDAP